MFSSAWGTSRYFSITALCLFNGVQACAEQPRFYQENTFDVCFALKLFPKVVLLIFMTKVLIVLVKLYIFRIQEWCFIFIMFVCGVLGDCLVFRKVVLWPICILSKSSVSPAHEFVYVPNHLSLCAGWQEHPCWTEVGHWEGHRVVVGWDCLV